MSNTWTDFIGTFMNFFWQMIGAGLDAIIGAGEGFLESLNRFAQDNLELTILFVFLGVFYFVGKAAIRRY